MKNFTKIEFLRAVRCIAKIGLLFSATTFIYSGEPPVKGGEIVIGDIERLRSENIDLNGEWQFFWKKFIDPNVLQVSEIRATVPGVWSVVKNPEISNSTQGYCSYQVKITLPAKVDEIALRFGDIGTSYVAFLNGREIARNGEPSDNPAKYKPFRLPIYAHVKVDSQVLNLTIWNANYIYSKGGLWNPITIGLPSNIEKLRLNNSRFEAFILGSYLILAIYHFAFFLLRRKDRSALLLALVCVLLSVRIILTDERTVSQIFPNLSVAWNIRFEFLDSYLAYMAVGAFIYELFSSYMLRKIHLAILFIFIGFSILSLLLSPYNVTLLTGYAAVPMLAGIVFYFVGIVRAAMDRAVGAKTFLLFSFIMILTTVNDILYANEIIYTRNLGAYGFVAFIFAQSFILAKRFSYSFQQTEELSNTLEISNKELTDYKTNLEIKVQDRTKELSAERDKSEKLLLNILPLKIAEELKQTGSARSVHFDSVTVLFTDFVGFTRIAENLTPADLVSELDRCFSYFDNVVEKYGLEKLKTIGDAYMAAGGIPIGNTTHPFDCALAALEIQAFMNQMKDIKEQQGFPYWELRLGMHIGPLVAGVVGEKKFAYDVWGDTVNTASRMESSGTPGAINISRELYDQIHFCFHCEFRGKVYAKNKGEIEMFFLRSIKPKYSVNGEGRVPNEIFKEIYQKLKRGAKLRVKKLAMSI